MNRFFAVYWKEDFVSTKWHSFEIHYCPAIVLGIQFVYFNKVFTNQQLSLFSGQTSIRPNIIISRASIHHSADF